MRVLIDGTCPYCRALGRAPKALDLGGTLEVRPQEVEGALDLDPKALWEGLHLLGGNPSFGPFTPLLWAGRILGLGPRVYRWVARGRPHA